MQGFEQYIFSGARSEYESIINIRPSASNRSMEIQSAALRDRIDQIVKSLLGDVQWQ